MRNGCGCIGRNSLCGWGSGSQGEENGARWAVGERSGEARSGRPITPCGAFPEQKVLQRLSQKVTLTGMYFRRLFWWIHGDEIGEGPEGCREEQLGSFNNRQDMMLRWSGSSRNGDFSFFFELCILFGCAGSSSLHMGFSLVAVRQSYSLVLVHGLLTVVASLVAEHGLRALVLSSCSAWA